MSSDHIIVASLIGQGKIGKGDVAEIVGDEVVQAFPHLIGAAVGQAGAGGCTRRQAGDGGQAALGEHEDLLHGVLVGAAGQAV